MKGQIIVFCVIALIVILVIYLAHDSEVFKKIFGSVKKVEDKINEKKEIEITHPPIIKYRNPGDKSYRSAEMKTKEFWIGRDKDNDLVIDSKKVEPKHALIRKRTHGDRVFYEFINYAQVNPSEYYNKKTKAYDNLYVKDGVELDEREAFYVGDTKLIIKAGPVRQPGDSDILGKDSDSSASKPKINRAPSTRVVTKKELEDDF